LHCTVVLPKKKKTHLRIHSVFITYIKDQVIIPEYLFGQKKL